MPGVWVDEFTKSNVAADNRIHRFVERHPEFLKLVPALLDRGDPIGRTLALGIACTLRTEQMLEALEAFAFGQYGPDEQRQRALSTLIEEGVVGRGPHEVYFDGRWSTILTSVIRISTNVTNPLPLESEPKATRALEAMKSGDFKSAEQLWNELITEYPDEPSFYNNLGACLEGLGREDEAYDMSEDLFARFPEYLFARISSARLAIQVGDIERARDLLRPLLDREEMHVDEAVAFYAAEFELALAQDNHKSAEVVLEMMRQAIGNNEEHVLQLQNRLQRSYHQHRLPEAFQRGIPFRSNASLDK